jgi:cytoskeletal protein CcmA (bactofilin family)
MWNKKNPDTTQAADREETSLQTNWPPKPASASSEGTNKDVTGPAGEAADRAPSRLGSSLHFKGEISGNEDLDIDGTVEGLVYIDERKLTVGAAAKLTADIIAGAVIVYGSVKGNVRGKGKIEIKNEGSVNGDLTTAQIIIERRSILQGLDRDREERGKGRGQRVSNHEGMLWIPRSG